MKLISVVVNQYESNSMTQNDVYSDTDDSSSNVTVDSEDVDIECSSVVHKQCQNNHDHSRINVNLNSPDKPSISHISSVALQNSTDITFGNKTLYSGPITVNQYGCETANLGKKTEPFYKRWRILLSIVIIGAMLISVATILILYFKNVEDGIPNIDNDNTPLRLVTREEWRARPATGDIDDLKTPVPFVILQHTVQASCYTMETCAPLVRQAQILHINSDDIQDDIGYNFLVDGDGAAYEGRGWDKIGAHTKGYNSRSVGVAFIGDFTVEKPTNQQIVALLKLIRVGVGMKKISQTYTLIGANQVQQTESPGKFLIQILTKLPHWSDQID